MNEDIWEAFERVLKLFPEDVFSDLPTDLAANHDLYLYGDLLDQQKLSSGEVEK